MRGLYFTNILANLQEKMQGLTKQIQDLPRQYRRTNRDWPSTPSAFMPRIVKHLTDLARVLQTGVLSKPQVEASPVLRSQVVQLFEKIVLQTTNMQASAFLSLKSPFLNGSCDEAYLSVSGTTPRRRN